MESCSHKGLNTLNLGPVYKNICHIPNQHPQIYQNVYFYAKRKIFEFGTKNTLFRYFWTAILKKYCHF